MLALPGFLYFLLKEGGKNRYKPLPIYGPKVVASTFHSVRGKQIPDTIYHKLDTFELRDQRGSTMVLAKLNGHIQLVNLFYTADSTPVAKHANQVMGKFAKSYIKNDLINFVSISVDESDSGQKLATFANTIKASSNWSFLSGTRQQIEQIATKGLLQNLVINDENGGQTYTFGHTFVLLDSQQRIRGFYDVANDEAKSKLEDEIKVLIAEELRNIKDGR